MPLLSSTLAQRIVDRTMEIIRSNVNVMDEAGRIIASGERARIGERHEGALIVLARERVVEIGEAAGSSLHDVRPGINLPLRSEGRVVGVVGVSGEPDAVRPFAELVRMAAETMIEQARLDALLASDVRLREELVVGLVSEAGRSPATVALAERLGVDLARPRVVIVLTQTETDAPADTLLATQQRCRSRLADLPGVAGLVAAPTLCELVGLCEWEDAPGAYARLHGALAELLAAQPVPWRAAIGGAFGGEGGLMHSLRSARLALRGHHASGDGAAVVAYRDRPLPILLADLAEGWRGEELSRPYARLAARDGRGELERTLAAWFAHGLRAGDTARALAIHRNTLDYRLARVAEITGLDLDCLDDILYLYVGMQLRGH